MQVVNRKNYTLDSSTQATICQSSKLKISKASTSMNKTSNILKQSLHKKSSTNHLLGKLLIHSKTRPETLAESKRSIFRSNIKEKPTSVWSLKLSKRIILFVSCPTNIFLRIYQNWITSMWRHLTASHQVWKNSRQWLLLPSRISLKTSFLRMPQMLMMRLVRVCYGKKVLQVLCQIWRIHALCTLKTTHQVLRNQ